jgi:hypothetical protein
MNRVLVALTIFALAAPPALAGGAAGGVVNKGGIVSPNGSKVGGGTDGRGVGGIVRPNGAKPGTSSGGSGPVKPFGDRGGIGGDGHK